jgi:hypothetical protein
LQGAKRRSNPDKTAALMVWTAPDGIDVPE